VPPSSFISFFASSSTKVRQDSRCLSHEVDDNEVQDDVRKDEVTERSFWTDAKELVLVLWVHLNS
jgi:hypothetical protein